LNVKVENIECKILADMPRRVTKPPKGINASIILMNISIRQILIFQKDKRCFLGHYLFGFGLYCLSFVLYGARIRK